MKERREGREGEKKRDMVVEELLGQTVSTPSLNLRSGGQPRSQCQKAMMLFPVD